jgi:hypothetical protein
MGGWREVGRLGDDERASDAGHFEHIIVVDGEEEVDKDGDIPGKGKQGAQQGKSISNSTDVRKKEERRPNGGSVRNGIGNAWRLFRRIFQFGIKGKLSGNGRLPAICDPDCSVCRQSIPGNVFINNRSDMDSMGYVCPK